MDSWDLRVRLRGLDFGLPGLGFFVSGLGLGFRVGGLVNLGFGVYLNLLPLISIPWDMQSLGTNTRLATGPNIRIRHLNPKPYTLNPKPCRAFETSEDPWTLKSKHL